MTKMFAKSIFGFMAVVLFIGATTTLSKTNPYEDDVKAALWDMMKAANDKLEADGENYRVDMAEYYTDKDEVGQEVFFNDRGNKQLSIHWVPGDPRRGGWSSGNSITYALDGVEGDNVLPIPATNAAIDRAMATWNNVQCSNIPIVKRNFPPLNLGIIGGGLGIAADITHSGFLGLPPGVLGVTFTFLFTSGGVPTDIDNNKKADTAFREIYYNVFFPWAINGNFDVETVALHEAGHGLSQAHFGKLFRTDANGKFHFAPRAVMNAGYTGVQQSIGKTDNAGHCSLFGNWPN